jgi:hypothetical protein
MAGRTCRFDMAKNEFVEREEGRGKREEGRGIGE